MKVLCLIDNPIPSGAQVALEIPARERRRTGFSGHDGSSRPVPEMGQAAQLLSGLSACRLPGLRKTRQTQYDVVVAWEGKNGFPYALFRSIAGQKSPRWSPPLTYGGDEPLFKLALALRAEVRLARDRLYAG